MKDMEFIYRYLVLPFWLHSYMTGGVYYQKGSNIPHRSTGWQGCVDEDDIHWFVKPFADTVESLIIYCAEDRMDRLARNYEE